MAPVAGKYTRSGLEIRTVRAPTRDLDRRCRGHSVVVSRVRVELERTAATEGAARAVDGELAPGVGDVEVAHRQLADAIERAERGVVDALHRQPLRRVRQLGAGRVDDRVVLAAAQAYRHLAGDRRADPTQQRLPQHQALGVEPAALVEQPAEAPAHRAVVLDRALVVDRRHQPLVGDVQQAEGGGLVDAPALGLDDAVLDLVAHAEPVAATDRVRFHHQLDMIGDLAAR